MNFADFFGQTVAWNESLRNTICQKLPYGMMLQSGGWLSGGRG